MPAPFLSFSASWPPPAFWAPVLRSSDSLICFVQENTLSVPSSAFQRKSSNNYQLKCTPGFVPIPWGNTFAPWRALLPAQESFGYLDHYGPFVGDFGHPVDHLLLRQTWGVFFFATLNEHNNNPGGVDRAYILQKLSAPGVLQSLPVLFVTPFGSLLYLQV